MQILDGATDAAGTATPFYPGSNLSATIRVQPSAGQTVTVDVLATLTPEETGNGSSILESGPASIPAEGGIVQYANRKLYRVTLVYSALSGGTLDAWANVYDEAHVQRLAW